MKNYFNKLQEHFDNKKPFVSVTLVEAKGSVPQIAGAKILVTDEGLSWGTIGGGKVEAKAITQAQQHIQDLQENTNASFRQDSRTLFCNWVLQKDVSMTCGGGVKLYFEAFNIHPWTIAIFGAGHVARALSKSLAQLDCQVLCFDDRADWLEKIPNNQNLTKTLSTQMAKEVASLPAASFVILMTKGHATDTPILVEALNRKCFPYIGVIGSKSKAAVIKKELHGSVDDNDIEKFFCPIGLALGSNIPEEISISICAQILQMRDNH